MGYTRSAVRSQLITLFTVAEMKGIMAHEVVDQYEVVNVHNSGTVHTVIVDYATGDIHVAFTIGGCADEGRGLLQ